MRIARLVIMLAAVLAATPAFAQRGPDCPVPVEPARRDGATLSRESIDRYRAEVTEYVTQTQEYERCVLRWLREQKEPSDTTKARIERQLIRNEENRFRVAGEFNAAAEAFNTKQGLAPDGSKPKLGEGMVPVQ